MIKITNSELNFEVFSGEGIYLSNKIEIKFKFMIDGTQTLIKLVSKNIENQDINLIKLDIANHVKNIYRKYIKGL